MTLPVIIPPSAKPHTCGSCHYWLGSYTDNMTMGWCRMKNSRCENMVGYRALGSGGMETAPSSTCDAWSQRLGVGY